MFVYVEEGNYIFLYRIHVEESLYLCVFEAIEYVYVDLLYTRLGNTEYMNVCVYVLQIRKT